ncbi:condensation domain-containing protein, partial [Agrobacterium cavarae]
TLPDYMVPAAYVRLDAMPLTPNGKLDRDALPAPDGAAYASRGHVPPQGPVEETLAAIWQDLLNIQQVGRNDNFFELGGHSLMAIQIVARMQREGLQCDIRTLFEAPTLAGLAATVRTDLDEAIAPNLIPEGCTRITPDMLPLIDLSQAQIDTIAAQVPGGDANIQDIYPLGPLQEGVLFHHLMGGEGDVYLVSAMLAFDSRNRLQGFLDALATVIARHDILRTGFVWEGLDQPAQVVWRKAPLQVEEVELNTQDGAAAQQLQQRFDPQHYRIDLGKAPLLRLFIARDEDNDRWLARLLHHHLVMDHTAIKILIGEVLAHLAGDVSQLQPPIPFRRFVAQARLGVDTAEHEAFFRTMLGDVVEPTAPFGLTNVHLDGVGLDEVQLTLEPDLAAQLRQAARSLKVSAASLFHLAWAMVLARSSGRQDVVFGTVLFGRMHGGAEADRGLGMFMNTLPLRVTLDGGVAESAERVQAALAALLRHEHAPLSLAQRCSGVAAPAPLFSSLLNYRHGHETEAGERPGQNGIEMLGGKERTNYPLVLSVDDLGERFMLKAQVPDPVGAERICRFVITALTQLVETLQQDPQAPVNALDVLPEDERRAVLGDFNETAASYSSDALIHELFEV